jgi:hypothetical protein
LFRSAIWLGLVFGVVGVASRWRNGPQGEDHPLTGTGRPARDEHW